MTLSDASGGRFDDQEYKTSVQIEVLAHNMRSIRQNMEEMRESMKEMQGAIKEMAAVMNKLAIVEERQNQHHDSMERAFNAIDSLAKKHDAAVERLASTIDKIDERVMALEKYEQLNAQIRVGVLGLIGIIGAALVYALLRVIGVQS